MESTKSNVSPPIVVNLGKQKRKAVKALCKGRGKLMNDVDAVVDQLRAAGTIAEGTQAVVVVVRERLDNPWGWPS